MNAELADIAARAVLGACLLSDKAHADAGNWMWTPTLPPDTHRGAA